MITSNDNITNVFRGFLIQAVTMADGTGVGTFLNLPQLIKDSNVYARIGPCAPEDSSATHMHPADVAPADRQSVAWVQLYWMSPPEGTGTILFRYVC